MPNRADYQGRLLKSALLHPSEVLLKVLYSLEPKDFSDSFYRQVFNILREVTKTGTNDTVTLIDALNAHNLDVSQLLDSKGIVYSINNISEPIKEVRNRAHLKALNRLHSQWVTDTRKITTNSQKHITRVMADISQLYNRDMVRNISQGVDSVLEQAKHYQGKEYFGLQTNLPDLDRITRGMQKKLLWLLGGYTAVGKTWFGLHVAEQHIKAGFKTLYLSFEMSMEELLWRLTTKIINDPQVTLYKAKTQNLPRDKCEQLFNVLEELRQSSLTIMDHLSTWEETRLHLLHQIYAEKVDCIIVDYLQNILVSKSRSEYESLNLIVRELQRLSVQHNVFILALSQISREAQKTDDDRVFGFKGSGNIENAADVAITMKKYGDTPEEQEVRREIIVGKNRTGNIGRFICDVNFKYGLIR